MGAGKSETNDWGAIIPSVIGTNPSTRCFALVGALAEADAETWLVPWTLSWQTSVRNVGLHAVGRVAHASWGLCRGPDYIFRFITTIRNKAHSSPLLVLLARRKGNNGRTLVALVADAGDPTHRDCLAGGLACSGWAQNPGQIMSPYFYHDAERLLTPLFGWDDHHNYCYLATPLAGFAPAPRQLVVPLYSHSRVEATGKVKDNFLLLGGHALKPSSKATRGSSPLFSYRNQPLPDGPIERGKRYQTYGQSFGVCRSAGIVIKLIFVPVRGRRRERMPRPIRFCRRR